MCDYEESPTFQNEKIIQARKIHKCTECHKIIKVKEKYLKIVGKWAGEIDTFKLCQQCIDIRDYAFELDLCIWYGEMINEIEEHLRHNSYRLTFSQIKKMLRLINPFIKDKT